MCLPSARVRITSPPRAGAAAGDAEARRRADAFAAEGVVGRREHLDLVVEAGAAAEAAGAGGVAAQLLAAEAHGIELLVGLEVGQRQAAQRDQVADQVEAVAALDARRRPARRPTGTSRSGRRRRCRPAVTACTAFDQPAEARSGSAWPSAFHIAWMISCATNTVFMVIGAGGRAFTSVPSGAGSRRCGRCLRCAAGRARRTRPAPCRPPRSSWRSSCS